MINCKGCPFLYDEEYDEEYDDIYYLCSIGYTVGTTADIIDSTIKTATSPDCKLEAVTYSLKDKKDSIDFIPKETDDSN